MNREIYIRTYQEDDLDALVAIYYHTVHQVIRKDYTQEHIDAWAPKSRLENTEEWAHQFSRTQPFVAAVGDEVVGFAEFEPNGHIECFYCHHQWIGKGVGSALMQTIFEQAKIAGIKRIFSEVSITAKPFFEKLGFAVICEQLDFKKGVGIINYKMEKLLK